MHAVKEPRESVTHPADASYRNANNFLTRLITGSVLTTPTHHESLHIKPLSLHLCIAATLTFSQSIC